MRPGLDSIPDELAGADRALAVEALRLNDRYLIEFIEPHGLCPYAEGARNSPELRRRVLVERSADALLAPTTEWLRSLADVPSAVVAILIYPRFSGALDAFEKFLRSIRAELDAAGSSPFVSALFHPRLKYSTATPQRLLTYFRRSPDPSLQFVRFSVLDQLKRRVPSGKFFFDGSEKSLAEVARRGEQVGLSERIARDNHALVATQGIAKLEAILDDIEADRARSYGALGELAAQNDA